jgi:hypothetical protein
VSISRLLLAGTRDGLAIYAIGADRTARLLRRSLPGLSVEAIVAADSETLLVAVEGQPARQSFDGGVSWTEASGKPPEPAGLRAVTTEGPMPLANPRLSGATAYALLRSKPPALLGAGAGGMMIFRSTDDGIHWAPARIATPAGNVTTLAPDTLQHTIAWAGTDSGALLRSDDQGATWQLAARDTAAIRCITVVAGPADPE